MRKPDSYADFLPHERVLSNPYIGFQSFQHFNRQPLFAEATPGWQIEFFPYHEDIIPARPEDGFYPDCTLAYFRICWRSFEPQDGVFNDRLIAGILDGAAARGQTVVFRLMPHTAREADIPDWLAERIPHPARAMNDEEYSHRNEPWCHVKESPLHPMFFDRFAAAIRHLGKVFDGNKSLFAVDVSLIGAWGEGYGSENASAEQLEKVADAYIEAFPRTQLLCQMCNSDLISHAENTRPMGIRGDCLGEPDWHMNRFYPYKLFEHRDLWKTAHISFEVGYTINTWLMRGWDIDEIIEQSLKWHISSFNAKYRPCPERWKPNIEHWLCHMGYRFAVRNVKYPATANPGEEIEIAFRMENRGVAPIYNALPLHLRLAGEHYTANFSPDTDIRCWLPGDNIETLTLALPKEMPKGTYELQIAVGGGDVPAVQLATETNNDGDYYCLVKIKVE